MAAVALGTITLHEGRLSAQAQTFQLQLPAQDTFLNADRKNYSTNTLLKIYTWPDYKIANVVVMTFDLSGVPAGAIVQQATLQLWLLTSDGTSDATYTVTAHKIVRKNPVVAKASGYTADGVNAWTSDGSSWKNAPMAQGDISAAVDTQAIDKSAGYKSWNVTSIVADWLANPSGNRGLLLNADVSKSRDRYRTFASTEHVDPALRPVLTVTYTAAPVDSTPPTVAITNPAADATVSGTVPVTATATDDTSVAGVQFRLDGAALGSEKTTAPYMLDWISTTASDGVHQLTAAARDVYGNTSVSAAVRVILANGIMRLPPDDTSLEINNTNHSRDPLLTTYTWPDNAIANAILMKFDLANLPAGAVVQEAKLYAWLVQSDAAPEPTYAVAAHKVTGRSPVIGLATGYTADGVTGWTPNACCSNGVPMAQADIQPPDDTRLIDKAIGFKTWTITAMVQEWLSNPAGNFGVLLNADPTKPKDRYRSFASIETAAVNLRPFLEIKYATGPPPDTTPPVVSVTAPASGATVTGTVTVSASATDDVAVAGVRFQVDGADVAPEDTTAPYSISWNTTTVAAGAHAITAVARDAAGNQTTSASIPVTVANDIPVVVITAPASGATVAGAVTVSATATDNVGVVGVQFHLDGVPLGAEDRATPHVIIWNTTTATNGSHTLTAVARDAAGNAATSAPISVIIANDPPANLIAAYAYDEGAGATAADAAPSHNTATLSATTWKTFCKYGSCLSFNGTSSVAESPDLDVLTPGIDATFEAWVLLNVPPTETVSVFNKWNQTANDEYLIGIDSNRKLTFSWHTTGGNTWGTTSYNAISGAAAIPLNTLTHIAVVRSGATLAFYINGNLDASSEVMDANPFRNGLNTLRIGGQGRGAMNRFFPGTIDEPRMYSRALTQVDLQNDMNTPIGPAAPDMTPPGISSVAVSSITSSAATITWTTNEASDSLVNYGLTTSYGSASPLNASLVTAHTMTVTGLAPATLYHARVRSRDAAGNFAFSSDMTFTTLDGTQPVVSITAPAADATVAGPVSVSATASDDMGVVGVQFQLDGVNLGAEDTTAPYAVSWNTTTAANGSHTLTAVARDADGNVTTSPAVSVTVANDTTPPVITGVAASPITASGATITWTTDEGSDSQVEYGLTTAYGSTSALNTSLVTAHSVALSGLTGSTLYHYRVRSRDAAGNLALSGDVTFTTLDGTPPTVAITAPPAGATVSGSAVTVSATASDNVGVVGVQFKLDGANLGAEDLTNPYAVSWNTTTAANGSHTLTAVARDAAGNQTTSGGVTVTVSNDTTPPTISAVAAGSITASGATITWTTDEGSDSQVEYGLTTAYGSTSALNASLVTAHSVALSGLTGSTLYHYRVRSRDAAGNLALSGDFTFTTLAPPPPAGLIAAYSYNEGAGATASDRSVNNNTGTVSGATWISSCQFSQCLSFNGTSNFVESSDIGALTLGTEATFEAWVSLAAAPTEPASIFNKWSQNVIDDEYIIGVNPNRTLRFSWRTTGGGTSDTWPSPSANAVNSTGVIPLNTFTHVAVVRAGVTVTFYINGNLDTTHTAVVDTNPFRNGVDTLRVGAQGRGGVGRFFTGLIDEARIYDGALSQAEIQADMNAAIGSDVTPPVLSAISVAGLTSSAATINWTTNESSDSQVEYGLTTAYGSTSPLVGTPVTAHSTVLGGLTPNTLYHYRVRSRDVAGNLAVSVDATFTTLTVDATLPTVSITAPAPNATVSGMATVTASATDNVGVVGVQFKLDGVNLGLEDTVAPYAIAWDTHTAAPGAHSLTAVARDAAGNQRTSTAVPVTVSNSQVTLAWDPNTEADLAGYKIHYGTASGVYSSTIDAGNVTTYTVTGLSPSLVYYFVVTAYDQGGDDSAFSNEVSR